MSFPAPGRRRSAIPARSGRAAQARPGSLALLLLLLSLTGCANEPEPVSVATWRHSVERYVWDQGNGDPNVLRDMSWDDVHKGFATMSDPHPARSTDAIGLLVGHPHVHGRAYFVFLLGLVRQGRLQAIQPLALRVDAGRFQWIAAPPDPAALGAYQRWSALPTREARADPYRRGSGAQPSAQDSNLSLAPGIAAPQPMAPLALDSIPARQTALSGPPFPRPEDSFRLDVSRNRVAIVHRPSGITWILLIPDAPGATQP